MTSRRYRWGLLAAFSLQVAVLGWLFADRALLLSRGKEIRLAVVPVDPRDFLRGDFVVLSFEMSQLASDDLAGDDEFTYGDDIYVALTEQSSSWVPVSIHRTKPPAPVSIKGRVVNTSSEEHCTSGAASCTTYHVTYNLERFFVPEGEGVALETLRNDQRVSLDIAVADDGRAAPKRLLVDSVVRYEETLF